MTASMSQPGVNASYLKSQSLVNPSLAYDSETSTLRDASRGSRCSALIAGSWIDTGTAVKIAPYVGPGLLSALLVQAIANGEPEQGMDDFKRLRNLLGDDAEVIEFVDISTRTQQQTSAEHAELRVPKLEMNDLVGSVSSSSDASESFGAGAVLMLKICGALAPSYDTKSIINVGKLVRDNTMTAYYGTSDQVLEVGAEESQDARSRVSKVLNVLLSATSERSRSVRMNSNEPVLLINNGGNLSDMDFGTVVTEAIEQVQRQWNIWPVRIYAGRFLESAELSFSITLLNVVNTDLGGPSMVQLLDAPCEARGWLSYARREVWTGREMLEREEKQQEAMITGHTAPQSPHSAGERPTDQKKVSTKAAEATGEDSALKKSADEELVDAVETKGEIKVVADAQANERVEDAEVDHPAPVGWEAPPERAPIRHPSWSHVTEAESLLDLIKSQASKIPHLEDESEADQSERAAKAENAEYCGPGSEDEFVVV